MALWKSGVSKDRPDMSAAMTTTLSVVDIAREAAIPFRFCPSPKLPVCLSPFSSVLEGISLDEMTQKTGSFDEGKQEIERLA